jgi:HSP20 family protein
MPDKTETTAPSERKTPQAAAGAWSPAGPLRREIDRLFDDFDRGLWSPFRRSLLGGEPWRAPAVDVVEKDEAYEVTAELPGLDEKNVEVALANGILTIRGEKQEEKEEKKKDYHLQERHFGAFERRFPLPDDIDAERIEATFRKGVLTVVLPKTAEARKTAKKIEIKTG